MLLKMKGAGCPSVFEENMKIIPTHETKLLSRK